MNVAAALLAPLLVPVDGGPTFELSTEPFADPLPPIGAPFTVAAADYDGDGDDDLLINRHNLAPLELWRNDDGRLRFVERAASGLDEAVGIRTLYAEEAAVRAAIDARDGDGLFVWHGPRRGGPWYFAFRRAAAGSRALQLEIRTNRQVRSVKGLAAQQVREPDEESVDVQIPADVTELDFTVRIQGNSHRLGARWRDGGPPMFLGAELTRCDEIAVWPPDPHGVAWVDVEGDERPELYIGRGALAGTLRTDEPPKRNRFFVATAGARLYRLAGAERFPEDWGRARQPQWVDVDGDGQPELYLGNRTSPNALYRREPDGGRYVDVAPELGLDVEHGDSFAWLDLDGDGRDDLVYLAAKDRVGVLCNVAGERFEPRPAEELGLQPPAPERAGRRDSTGEYFETLGFHVADFDADGRLDLMMTGHRSEGAVHLFVARERGFVDVSDERGLADLRGVETAFTLDADNDGFEDVACLRADGVLLLHNRGGERFEPRAIGADWERTTFGTGCALDVDGDDLEDLVLVSGPRFVALNRGATENGVLQVSFSDHTAAALGSVVVAGYESGRRCAARFGSQGNPPSSQTARPLRFGVPAGDRVVELRVERGGAVTTITVPDGARDVVVPR